MQQQRAVGAGQQARALQGPVCPVLLVGDEDSSAEHSRAWLASVGVPVHRGPRSAVQRSAVQRSAPAMPALSTGGAVEGVR